MTSTVIASCMKILCKYLTIYLSTIFNTFITLVQMHEQICNFRKEYICMCERGV